MFLHKFKDCIGVGWNGWSLFTTSDNQSSTIKYYHINSGAYYGSATGSLVRATVQTNGAGHVFNVSANKDNLYYAKSGTGYFKVKSDVSGQKNFYYTARYGHAQISLNPSFSVSVSGINVGLSFIEKMNVVGISSGKYEF